MFLLISWLGNLRFFHLNYLFKFWGVAQSIILVICFILFIIACESQPTDANKENNDIPELEIPLIKQSDEIIKHLGYTLSYNKEHEQANWVAYKLTNIELLGSCTRTNNFRKDTAIKNGSAELSDYSGSGYDRGHLAPAADMVWGDCTAMSESFLMSNMSPQAPGFNRGIWKDLEYLVRGWISLYDTLYIVTAGVLHEGLKTIGSNKVSVPEYFYKVLLRYDKNDVEGIGFLMKNDSSSKSLDKFVVTIDSIESLTGIDFFEKLPDKLENKIENKVDFSSWYFYAIK